MEENNYFQIEDLPIEYPIYITTNGRKWNFSSEYLKRVKALNTMKDENHKLFDLIIDLDFFTDKVYKNVPILVTDDIRVKGDKRSYYIVDYLIPSKNIAILLFSESDCYLKVPKFRYLRKVLENLKITVMDITDISKKSDLPKYLRGMRSSISFMTELNKDEFNLPRYFK